MKMICILAGSGVSAAHAKALSPPLLCNSAVLALCPASAIFSKLFSYIPFLISVIFLDFSFFFLWIVKQKSCKNKLI